jgi:hypothetical protein
MQRLKHRAGVGISAIAELSHVCSMLTSQSLTQGSDRSHNWVRLILLMLLPSCAGLRLAPSSLGSLVPKKHVTYTRKNTLDECVRCQHHLYRGCYMECSKSI